MSVENTTAAQRSQLLEALHRARVRRLLPAGAVALYGSRPATPACTCRSAAPCRTCQAYDAAGRGIEAAALALGQGGRSNG